MPIATSLPSTEEIKSAFVLVQRGGQTTVAVTPDIVAKFGAGTVEREGYALLFLEERVPSFPAPRLYAMYRDDDALFLVMERIRGVRLDSLWERLTERQKASVAECLRGAMTLLREIEPPRPGFFGSVDGGPVPHHLFYSPDADRQISGPFSDDVGFVGGLVSRYTQIQEENGCPVWKAGFYDAHMPKILRSTRPTFTHGDLQRKNIIIREGYDGSAAHGKGLEPVVVDWEDAGWYPAYWEYFAAFTAFRWDDDWCEKIEHFLTAWPAETAMLKMIYHDLFF